MGGCFWVGWRVGGWVGGRVESCPFFWNFWNFFNFEKPLSTNSEERDQSLASNIWTKLVDAKQNDQATLQN